MRAPSLRRTGVILLLAAALAAPAAPAGAPERVISLVPNVTRMLVAIGAGPRLAGAGSFDRLPPDLAHVPRVGGLLDPDLERIFALRPDLVIAYATQTDLREQLARAGIAVYPYRHEGLAGVTATIRDLGRVVGHAAEAGRVAAGIERDLDRIARRVAGRPKPRTLLVFGRTPQTLRGIDASGGVGFLHDMLERAGGRNVFADIRRESVRVSTETVLAQAPEVIVELVYGRGAGPGRLERERQVWKALPAVPAVRHGRIYLLAGDEMVSPGPDVAEATERIARALHPTAF